MSDILKEFEALHAITITKIDDALENPAIPESDKDAFAMIAEGFSSMFDHLKSDPNALLQAMQGAAETVDTLLAPYQPQPPV